MHCSSDLCRQVHCFSFLFVEFPNKRIHPWKENLHIEHLFMKVSIRKITFISIKQGIARLSNDLKASLQSIVQNTGQSKNPKNKPSESFASSISRYFAETCRSFQLRRGVSLWVFQGG